VGDIVLFDLNKNPGISRVCSALLAICDSRWRKRDRKFWHTAIVSRKDRKLGWMIFEGNTPCTREIPLASCGSHELYRWFDKPVTQAKMRQFVEKYTGRSYDAAVYILTALTYLLHRYFNIHLPRILDDKYTCWELVYDACFYLGKPLGETHNYPMLPDMLESLESTNETK